MLFGEEFYTKRTVLVVAHRMHTLHICDKILMLDEGKVAYFGEFEGYKSTYHKEEHFD